jgi:hypothetical protein
MAFMGMLKDPVSGYRRRTSSASFFGNCPAKFLEKFQIFSDTTAGFMASFRLRGAQAAGL